MFLGYIGQIMLVVRLCLNIKYKKMDEDLKIREKMIRKRFIERLQKVSIPITSKQHTYIQSNVNVTRRDRIHHCGLHGANECSDKSAKYLSYKKTH